MSGVALYDLIRNGLGWKPGKDSSVVTNTLEIVIAARAGHHIQVGVVTLNATTGGGGAEAVQVLDGTDVVWDEPFTVGTAYKSSFLQPISGTEGGAVTVKASATALTTGLLYCTYRYIPA